MGSAGDSSRPEGELERLLAATLERIEEGGSAALEEACRAHPAHAALLRQRVLALRELGLIQSWSSDKPPQQLGDFRLLRRIGSGGMGVVYHAVQESLGREVALKLIRPETLHVPGARERFARETTIIARLQHPGIVPIYSVGGAEDLPYYAMELVRGCTLADALAELEVVPVRLLTGADLANAVRARSAELDPSEPVGALYDGTWEQVCLRLLRLVAEALEHAHLRGVLHRDLKPSNVMLTLGGRVMLVDFGLSHSDGSDSVTKSGERAGSLPFMPPELLRAGLRRVDRRSDVYALGVTLFLLLARRMPFAGENEAEIYARILEGRPPRVRALNRAISWEAETVCLAAMDRDPDRRYATATEFARDLERALERRPVAARRASPWLRGRRWVQRRPAAAVAILLAVGTPTVFAFTKAAELARTQVLRDEADGAGRVAQANFERTLRSVDAMLRRVGQDRLDHIPGLDPLRIELIGEATALYRELARERPDDPALAVAAAESELVRAKLLHRGGDVRAAVAALHELLERLQPALEDYAARRSQACAWLLLSSWSPDPEDAEAFQAATLGAFGELRRERPDDAAVLALYSESLTSLIQQDRGRGASGSGLAMLDLAEDLARNSVAKDPSVATRANLAHVVAIRGSRLAREGRYADALAPLSESLALRRALLAEVPDGEHERNDVCESASALAGVLSYLGRRAEALELLLLAAREMECLLADYPHVEEFYGRAADVMLNLGATHGLLRQEAESRAALERAAALFAALQARRPHDPDLHQQLGTTLLNLSDSVLYFGEPEKALETCDRCLAQFQAALAARPDHPDYAAWLAPERSTRAKILLALGRTAEAAEVLADGPKLAGHLKERAVHCLKRLLVVIERAESEGDPEIVDRCYAAAETALARAHERGDLEGDPTVKQLAEILEGW